MKPICLHRIVATAMLGFAASAGTVYAQTSNMALEAADMDDIAGTAGGARVQQRLIANFSAFAGSTANARSLVTGLRSGTAITLTSAGGTGTSGTGTSGTSGTGTGGTGAGGTAQGTAAVTITPPTRPMGYGNIFIALSLAQKQLAAQGITHPTPQQLQLALSGGSVTSGNPPQTQTVQGVLQLRSQGMGWGQIAHSYGVKLGPVVSSMKSANLRLAEEARARPVASSVTGSATVPVTTAMGVRNAAGVRAEQGHAESGVHSRGIVSAGGGAGNVHAYGAAHASGMASAGGGDVDAHAYGSAHARGTAVARSAPETAIGHAASPGLARGSFR